MCDYGQGGVTDVPAQLRTSVRREEAEGVTHWKSGGGGWLAQPQTLIIRGTLEPSSGA